MCRPDLCAYACQHAPKDYLGRIWTDSLVHDDRALEFLVSIVGKNRILLGSDYPFPLGEIDREGKIVEQATFLTDQDKADILANNVFSFVGKDRADYE